MAGDSEQPFGSTQKKPLEPFCKNSSSTPTASVKMNSVNYIFQRCYAWSTCILSEHLILGTENKLFFPERLRFRLVSFVKCISQFSPQPDFFIGVCFYKNQSLYQNHIKVKVLKCYNVNMIHFHIKSRSVQGLAFVQIMFEKYTTN